MKRPLTLLILILTLAAGTYKWATMRPSIQPDDIILKGVLKEIRLSPQPKQPAKEDSYVVEITLNIKTPLPLYVSDHKYFYEIFPYVEGFPQRGLGFLPGPGQSWGRYWFS